MTPDSPAAAPPPAAAPRPLSRWLARLRSGGGFLARHSLTTAGHLLRALAYGVSGGSLVLLAVAVSYLNGRPDLSPWHEVELEEEFTADSEVSDFAGYLRLEDRLFTELDQKIYGSENETGETDEAAQRSPVDRFASGSLADPRRHERNWNRTFELPRSDEPTAGVLLLHGMSDSPYSLRALGERLNQEGAHVIGLRLPGHGTAPSGLVDFAWEDMDAAVRLAMARLREAVGDQPIHLVGYSNGGALAVHYALEAAEDPSLPRASRIVLISPAIGVTPMAALAVWQSRLGHWLGLEKLEWNSILPEYDPYKYNSFAVNAGHQVYRLTTEIGRHLDRFKGRPELETLPAILAFQSAVDATVSTPALVAGLFDKLPPAGHELVLFDLNRMAQIEHLLVSDPTGAVSRLVASADSPFAVTLLTNRDPASPELEIRTARAGKSTDATRRTPIPLAWPREVYSLSHVSLPFPREDTLYGSGGSSPGVLGLGNIALRGERGVLQVSPADQLRLRWNPFFPYLEARVLAFLLPGERG